MAYHQKFINRMIEDASQHERTQQTRIGPSGLGVDCHHCLGAQLAQLPKQEDDTYVWAQIKGHQMHEYMEDLLQRWNEEHGSPLFFPERKLVCGEVGGVEIDGTADCYDIEEDVVVDWKFPADYTMSKVGKGQVSAAYLTQPHVYGAGYERLGFTPKKTCILFFPIGSSRLSDAIAVTRPYDPGIAAAAFKRANDIWALMQDKGPEYIIPRLKRKPGCFDCPRYAI